MTLIAGFRGRNGGVLLCTDREEGDGYSKRSVDKIFTIDLQQGKVLIAGAGAGAIIRKACMGFEEALRLAETSGLDLAAESLAILEQSLESTYERYVKGPELQIGLLVVVALYDFSKLVPPTPQLYTTEGAMILPAPLYAAHGSGKLISDYLADRLYIHGMDRVTLTTLAVFIFREASSVSSGVGLGTDTVMVNDGDRSFRYITDEAVKELEDGIPSLRDSVLGFWKDNLRPPPNWLNETLFPSSTV